MNATRSRGELLSRAASLLVTLASLALAVILAFAVGLLGWASTGSSFSTEQRISAVFLVLTFIYMLWIILPVTMGSGREFDPGRLLLYPVSLRLLFAVDWIGEVTSLASIVAIPMVLALALGLGIGAGNLGPPLAAALLIILSGLAISKFVTTSLNALIKRKRTRGETLIALVGVTVGVGGALLGQLIPYFISNSALSFEALKWTPSGAAAIAIVQPLGEARPFEHPLALLTLASYAAVFVVLSYQIARRSALDVGGAKRVARPRDTNDYGAGWALPFISTHLSAVIEKEVRYAVRNAQLRMLAVMPLMLIAFRLLPAGEASTPSDVHPDLGAASTAFAPYTEGLLAAAGVLYVFLLLASLACNAFGFEGGGMRAFVLAPIDRRTILIGKNAVMTLIATGFSMLLLIINQIVFRDLTIQTMAVVILSMPIYAVIFALVGNWLSLRFPKGMKFGKRMNVSGTTGLMLLPLAGAMALPPLVSATLGWLAQSLVIKYATLTMFALIAVTGYRALISRQGRHLASREQAILEAVSKEE